MSSQGAYGEYVAARILAFVSWQENRQNCKYHVYTSKIQPEKSLANRWQYIDEKCMKHLLITSM